MAASSAASSSKRYGSTEAKMDKPTNEGDPPNERHGRERQEMFDRHLTERSDMFKRHEGEHKTTMERHLTEMMDSSKPTPKEG